MNKTMVLLTSSALTWKVILFNIFLTGHWQMQQTQQAAQSDEVKVKVVKEKRVNKADLKHDHQTIFLDKPNTAINCPE